MSIPLERLFAKAEELQSQCQTASMDHKMLCAESFSNSSHTETVESTAQTQCVYIENVLQGDGYLLMNNSVLTA